MIRVAEDKKINEINLFTDRLVLKQLGSKHAELVLDYLNKNESHFTEWTPNYIEEYFTVDYQRKLLSTYETKVKNAEMAKFWIFKADDYNNSRIIGDISFGNIIWGVFKSCHVGYKMDEDFLNEGYMTEALDKAINFMFNVFKLHRIEANIMPSNEHSIALAKKLGFTKEGFSPKYLKINGVWENHLRYAIINEDLE